MSLGKVVPTVVSVLYNLNHASRVHVLNEIRPQLHSVEVSRMMLREEDSFPTDQCKTAVYAHFVAIRPEISCLEFGNQEWSHCNKKNYPGLSPHHHHRNEMMKSFVCRR